VGAYVDASVLVPLFVDDPFSQRAEEVLRGGSREVLLSDFASAEFASAVGRMVRMRRLSADQAREAFVRLDQWTERSANRVVISPHDVGTAAMLLRRLDLNLRTPDAINLAIADRLAAELVTFDSQMLVTAVAIGIGVRGG
jgi:predicted nucleic acid-binding protein